MIGTNPSKQVKRRRILDAHGVPLPSSVPFGMTPDGQKARRMIETALAKGAAELLGMFPGKDAVQLHRQENGGFMISVFNYGDAIKMDAEGQQRPAGGDDPAPAASDTPTCE